MVYDSFKAFMEELVIPNKETNPDHERLDGEISGSSRKVFGVFRHHNKIWKVDADTRYQPLLRAFDFMNRELVSDPFVEKTTSTGKGKCLVLREEIKKSLPISRFKHYYIYEIPQK